MSIVTSRISTRMTKQPEQRSFPILMGALLLFICLYTVLVILAPLSTLRLSNTPLSVAMPWLLIPANTLQGLTTIPWLAPFLLGAIFLFLLGIYAFTLFMLFRAPSTQYQGRSYFFLLLGGTGLFGLMLLFLPALFSDSVFTAMFTGRILTVYGENPLNTAPIQFPTDAYLPWVISGRENPNVAGPLWLYICALLSMVSSDPLVSLFVFKGVALGAHLLSTVLIWSILGAIAPERRLPGTLLYAWSPLALIELAGNGQGEGIQVTLLLLATWLFIRASSTAIETPRLLRVAAVFTLGLAVSVNLITLLIAPLALWFMQRHQRHILHAWLTVSWQAALLLLPEILLILPFWRGTETFFAITSSVDMAHFVHSPVSLLALPLRWIFQQIAGQGLQTLPGIVPADLAADLTIRASATCVFVLIYAHLFSRVRRAPYMAETDNSLVATSPTHIPGLATLIDCCTIAVFWYLILVSGWFWPWYLLWFLWMVALRRIDRFASAILLLSGTALLIYAFVGFSQAPLATYQTAFIFGIPLLFLLVVRKGQGFVERISVSDVQQRSSKTQN